MPGFSGIIGKIDPGLAKEKLASMRESMWSEAFYILGDYSDEKLGVYVSWSCIKGSFGDCMPILNEVKDKVLFFTGEDFADQETVRNLGRRGHVFSDSDGSYLVHAYEEMGEDSFFKWLNGWFTGLLMDNKRGTAVLFNDRFGVGRLYYHESEDAFYFSSEAKAILRICDESRVIDEQSLAEYLSCGCVLENRTFFRDIFVLPPGSAWAFDRNKRIERKKYFDPVNWERQFVIDKEEYYRQFREIFRRVLPSYFSGHLPVGLSLTGGLDTRMILASLNPQERRFPCYTFGGLKGDILDINIARKVAEACGQDHHVLRLGENFLRDFESLASKTILVTDGTADICGSHEIYLNRLAREIAPVRMTGNYGGEVLREVSTFKAELPPESLFEREFYALVIQGADLLRQMSQGKRVSFAVFKEIPWRHFGILAAAQSQVTVRSPYMDNELVSLVYRAPAEARASNELALRLLSDADQKLANIATDQGVGGRRGYISRRLAQSYYRFLFKTEYYLNDGMPHLLSASKGFLPIGVLERLFLGKHKYLFYRKWFGNELSEYVKSILCDRRTEQRSFVDRPFLRRMVANHMSGRANYTNEICKLISVELIHRLLIESNQPMKTEPGLPKASQRTGAAAK